MLIVIDPPRNAIEIIFGKSNDYSSAMRLAKYFAGECGFHLGFDESYRLVGICLPRHQIRLSLLEELSRCGGGEEASWDDNRVKAKIKAETSVTKEDGTLIIRFTHQPDRAYSITNRSSKFPIFAILTEERDLIHEFKRRELVLNGFAIPLGILPDGWLEEIDVVSGGDCLKDPNSDFVGNPALPEQKSEEFFGSKTPSPKMTLLPKWAQETVPQSFAPDREERPPASRAFQRPRPPSLVVSPRIEVLATAIDGSGVETEVCIFHKGEKEALVDRGRTNARFGGWWRSKKLPSAKYNVITILQTAEATYFDSCIVDLGDNDVTLESGPTWRRVDSNQKLMASLLKNLKHKKQEVNAQILERGTIIRVLSAN